MGLVDQTLRDLDSDPAHGTVPRVNRLAGLPVLAAGKPLGGVAIETPQVSVVIVNFCQWKNTARLTRQLRQSEAIRRGAAEIVIVDNHSPGNRIPRKLRRLSGVHVIRSRRNQGFAKAVNRGSRESRGEWVLMLNPDVTVPEGFLDEVLEKAQRYPAIDPKAGVVGFQLRNRDGTRQASSGPYPTFASTVAGLMLPRSRRKCRHQSLDGRRRVPWVTGGCLLVRRDCFEQLRGLDESYFLYYEDVDFCRRAEELGWAVWYEPELLVTHHFPLHSRKVPPPLRLVTRHALLTYARKHWRSWQTRLLGGMVWAEAWTRGALASFRGETIAATCYEQMRLMVGDLLNGREDIADDRLRFAAAFLVEPATANDGRTGESQ